MLFWKRCAGSTCSLIGTIVCTSWMVSVFLIVLVSSVEMMGAVVIVVFVVVVYFVWGMDGV